MAPPTTSRQALAPSPTSAIRQAHPDGAGSRHALPRRKDSLIFSSTETRLAGTKRDRGLSSHSVGENKGFGCAGLRLNPDTVAYSVYMTLGNLASLPLFSY